MKDSAPRLATEEEWLRGRQSAPVPQREYLLFRVGGEDYALEIQRIREIIRVRPPTEVPRVPPFVLGVVSVRGVVLPVIDLALRLGLRSEPWVSPGPEHAGERSTLRYLIVARDDERFGLLVDQVRQVVRLQEDRIEPPPPMLSGDGFIAGIGRPRRDGEGRPEPRGDARPDPRGDARTEARPDWRPEAAVTRMVLLQLDAILRFEVVRQGVAPGGAA